MLIFEAFRGIFKCFIPKKPKCIRGKLALITGGGNGIGKSLAFKFAAKGCNICIIDINIAAATSTADEIAEKFKVKAKAFRVDVSKFEEVDRLKSDVESSMGFVDLLVNNVGLLALDVSLREQSPERYQEVINVNLMSHFWVSLCDFYGDLFFI